METKRGVLLAFDSGSYRASVLLTGSATAVPGVAVSRSIDTAEMVTGRSVAVTFFDLANPQDAVVVAVWT